MKPYYIIISGMTTGDIATRVNSKHAEGYVVSGNLVALNGNILYQPMVFQGQQPQQ